MSVDSKHQAKPQDRNMKLSELKEEVYSAADVTSTQQLKAKHTEMQTLNMSYKASWEKALALLNKSKEGKTSEEAKTKPTNKNQPIVPSSGGDNLLGKAEAALTSIGDKILEKTKATQTAKSIAEGLSDFADTGIEEAQKIAQSIRLNQDD